MPPFYTFYKGDIQFMDEYVIGVEGKISSSELDKIIKMSDIFNVSTDYLLKEDIAEALKQKILGRYLLKTTTQYAKADSETKKAYGEKLSEVYSFMKSSGMNYWWNYYSIENKNSAKELRIEYLKSKFKFTLFKILGRNK